MYNPAHFNTSDLPQLHALMRAHPLGVLITQGAWRAWLGPDRAG